MTVKTVKVLKAGCATCVDTKLKVIKLYEISRAELEHEASLLIKTGNVREERWPKKVDAFAIHITHSSHE